MQNRNHSTQSGKSNNSQLKVIALPTIEGYEFILYQDIIYCKGENNYSTLYLTNNRKMLVSKCLKQIDELLVDQAFFRIHKSTIINLSYVKKFLRKEGGQVVMNSGVVLNISKSRKSSFFDFFIKKKSI